MTYGIVTHYDVHNHGAILQLNALVKLLQEKYQIEASALQFDKNYDFLGRKLKAKYEISARSLGIYIKYLHENGLRRTLFNLRKKQLLERFKRANKLIGAFYTECGNLDGIIIGSDEVFALHTGPTPLFYGHGCPSENVFSYAGSFGPTTLEEIERLHCRNFIASGLSAMKGIAMRDENSASIGLKLTGNKPVLVCDPVILYGYTKEIASFTPINLSPYLLVYSYDQNMNAPEEITLIRDFAKSRQLKIVSAGFYHKWADYNINVDPVELLRYFKYADYVLTDTFHGSVLSLVTEKNFAVKVRHNTNKLLNLMQEYGLQQRILSDTRTLDEVFSEKLNYGPVRDEIHRRKSISLNYLTEMVTS